MGSQSYMLRTPWRSDVARHNRSKRKGLSDAGRERLREAAKQHQPWKYSTGPKTPWGKYLSARNGKIRQKGELSVRELRAEVKANRDLLKFLLEHPESLVPEGW